MDDELTGLDTPSLRGLHASAPYLHDGSAPNLETVLIDANPDDLHGSTSDLDEANIADLLEYLLSLEYIQSMDSESAKLRNLCRWTEPAALYMQPGAHVGFCT
jgi:hypothetical protein